MLQLSPLLRVVLSLSAGVFLAEELHTRSLPIGILVAFVVAMWIGAAYFNHKRRLSSIRSSVFLLLAIFAFGTLLYSVRERAERRDTLVGRHRYEAVLYSEPSVHGKVIQFDLMPTGLHRPRLVKASLLRDTIRNDYLQLHLGDGIKVQSTIESLSTAHPSPANRHRFQTMIGIGRWQKASISLLNLTLIQRAQLRLLFLRHRLLNQLLEDTGSVDSPPRNSIAAAVTLGERSAIDKNVRNNYRLSGASHVLAISGLHLGIIYGAVVLLFGGRRRIFGQIVALPVVWLYALMVGMPPSVVRAAVMLTIYGFITLLGRQAMSLNTLSLVAIVMILCKPHVLWDVGFQMSFLAVLGIVLFYQPLRQFLINCMSGHPFGAANGSPIYLSSRILSGIVGLMAVSISAQLMVSPLSVYYFGRFPTYFLLTNLVAVPLITLIIYLSLLLFLVFFVPSWQDFLRSLITGISDILNHSLASIASLPGASIGPFSITFFQLILVYVVEFCLIAFLVRLFQVVRRNRFLQLR